MNGLSRRRLYDRECGYSLIEVMVTILLVGVLMAMGAGSFRDWALAKDHEGAALDLQTVLRQTHVRAVTEGVTFCVDLDAAAATYTVYRYACDGTGQKVSGPFRMNDPRVELTDPKFLQADGSYSEDLRFRPSGSATGGSVQITRTTDPKAYLVAVEGFTGRVSIN